ncbi:hypothetical protein ACOCJ4_16390 [Knoellia sp. CPCC 206435]|uniref:hypothetical protein n=1 Tax=Knoellia terrae TaxID=3404797 RepID=UPI003B438451
MSEGLPVSDPDKGQPDFVKDLVAAGARAPEVLARRVVGSHADQIHKEALAHRAHPEFDVEHHVERLVKSQLILVRSEGAGAGLATTLAGIGGTATAGPPGALAATGVAIVADLAALSWIQMRLTLMIAAAYGHDPRDATVRMKEVLALHNLETAGSKKLTDSAQKGAQRVAKRLLERHLRGPLLQTITAMFRVVGIKFSRAALIRGLPFLNVPINAAIADVTTRRTSTRARKYYRSLPVTIALTTEPDERMP